MEIFDPSQLSNIDLDRMKSYQNRLDFYHGNQWEGRAARNEKRLTFNYSRVFIDKITSYLMAGMSFAVDPENGGDDSGAQRAEAALRRVFADNNLEQLDQETEIDCAILGDAAYKVTWDAAAKRVRVTAPDVQGIYIWLAGDDISTVLRVASRYPLNAAAVEKYYHLVPASKSPILVEVWTDTEFQLYLDNTLIENKENPYGFIPFLIFPNVREPKQFWGISDLQSIIEIQRELNRAMSQLSRILELSGNPIAVLENIEQSDDIAVKPGAVWNIPEDAKAYLLDLLQGGGVNLHIDYINMLYRTLHDISESPRAAFGGTERDLSGVALELELQPLLQKVNRKRTIRNAVYNRRNRMILKLLEKFTGEKFGPCASRIIWPQILPKETERQVANAQIMVQNGISSRRQAMNELGIANPETEFKRWLEERESILKMNKELNAKASTVIKTTILL